MPLIFKIKPWKSFRSFKSSALQTFLIRESLLNFISTLLCTFIEQMWLPHPNCSLDCRVRFALIFFLLWSCVYYPFCTATQFNGWSRDYFPGQRCLLSSRLDTFLGSKRCGCESSWLWQVCFLREYSNPQTATQRKRLDYAPFFKTVTVGIWSCLPRMAKKPVPTLERWGGIPGLPPCPCLLVLTRQLPHRIRDFSGQSLLPTHYKSEVNS